jgi:hypothetical protein
VTGNFAELADFGGTTLASAGLADVYVARYAPTGEVLWAERAGGGDTDIGRGIAVDASGQIYTTGIVSRSAAFGSTTLHGFTAGDIFVASMSEMTVTTEPPPGLPQESALLAAYPSPFSNRTTVVLTVSRTQQVMVEVFDVLGRHRATLYADTLAAGETPQIHFEAGDLPRGIYVIRASGEHFAAARTVVLAK